jgi:hypothetical protein
MNEPTTPDSANETAQAYELPKTTTATWETELLLAGAVVFALINFIGWLDGQFDWLFPHLTRTWSVTALIVYIFTKLIVGILAGTFVIYLAVRAFWIALSGLRSVFPGGIRWDRVTQAENLKRISRAHTPPIDAQIEQVDNLASLVFAFGVLMAVMSAIGLLFATAFLGLAAAVSSWLFSDRWLMPIFFCLYSLVFLPVIGAVMVDRVFGARIKPLGITRKVLNALMTWNFAMFRGRWTNNLVLTLTSNMRRGRGFALLFIGNLALGLLMALSISMRYGGLRLEGRGALPVASKVQPGLAVDSRHYLNLRSGTDTYSPQPMIQSDVISDPFVKLFIPFRPDRYAAALIEHCPTAAAEAKPDATRQRDLLKCISELNDIAIDSRALGAVDLHYYTEPKSDLRGVVAYLPTAELAHGAHELSIKRVRSAEAAARDRAENEADEDRIRIAFWF